MSSCAVAKETQTWSVIILSCLVHDITGRSFPAEWLHTKIETLHESFIMSCSADLRDHFTGPNSAP